MKDSNELRKLSVEELEAEILSLRKTQFSQRLKQSNGTLDKPHHVKNVRREIARVKTILSEKVRGKS